VPYSHSKDRSELSAPTYLPAKRGGKVALLWPGGFASC